MAQIPVLGHSHEGNTVSVFGYYSVPRNIFAATRLRLA